MNFGMVVHRHLNATTNAMKLLLYEKLLSTIQTSKLSVRAASNMYCSAPAQPFLTAYIHKVSVFGKD